MKPLTAPKRSWRLALPAIIACLAATTAACGPDEDDSNKAKDETLTIWTDSTREAAFKAFASANKDVKVKIQVVDAAALLSKIQLANRVGDGWPDVIFDSTPGEVAALSSPLFKYAEPLDDLIPQGVQDEFAGENTACTIDGKLYCLQNDLAQDVLWVNKPLMDEFGYDVPTTWEEYQALGEQVAAEHPGYTLGAVGDVNIWYDFLYGSGCPLANVKSSTQVQINAADTKCTRVADLLDPMLANGSVSRLSPFDPSYIKQAQQDKMLMIPGPSWFGEFVLNGDASYNLKDGKILVAPIPTWDGETTNYSGAWGGGIYLVSSHAADKKAAAEVIQWVTTNDAYQSTAPTYPAYAPAVAAWSKTMAASKFYVEDPVPVLTEAASKINPGVAPTRYQIPLASTLVAAIKDGGTIADALPGLQEQLAGLAAVAGYEVVQ